MGRGHIFNSKGPQPHYVEMVTGTADENRVSIPRYVPRYALLRASRYVGLLGTTRDDTLKTPPHTSPSQFFYLSPVRPYKTNLPR